MSVIITRPTLRSFVITLLAIWLFAGCESRKQNYHVGVRNESAMDMRGITVGFDKFAMGPMFLGSGKQAEYLFVSDDHSWPTNAFVEWKLPDNKGTSCWFRVPPLVCTNKIPTLTFLFAGGSGWKVAVE